MEIIKTIGEVQNALEKYRNSGKTVGFVPTMGALHEGHLSLLRQSKEKDDIAVVSIYVNPTQFNDKADLKKYPRDIEADCKKLSLTGCDIAFTPDDHEMYPEKDTRVFDLGEMATVLEGKFRPGHFNGVAQIVTKLFDAVNADRAYFGKKDFQQLTIIRKLVKDLHYPIEIIACPVIREADGLAMSSRNQLLGTRERAAAPRIYQLLREAKKRYFTDEIEDIEKFVLESLNSDPVLQPEYFWFVDALCLHPVHKYTSEVPVNACIAVYAGKVRLIDNIDIIS